MGAATKPARARKPAGSGDAASAAASPTAPAIRVPAPAPELREIPVAQIVPSPDQPRQTFDETELGALAESMAVSGLLQPIAVRAVPGQRTYALIAGERRWRAAQRLGWSTIPALVHQADDERAAEWTTAENLQRVHLSPLEEAEAFAALMQRFRWSQGELARRLGIPRATVGDRVRVLELPLVWLDEIRRGPVLQLSHAPTLHAYRAAPDAVHVDAVARFLTLHEVQGAAKTGRPLSVEGFGRLAFEAYRPDLHPLSRDTWDGCVFDPAVYEGPRVMVRRYATEAAQPFAADPERWRPLVEAAKTANAGVEPTSRTREVKPVVRARVSIRLGNGRFASRDVALVLPRRTEIAKVEHVSAKVPGATILTTARGTWDVEDSLRAVDVPWLEAGLIDTRPAPGTDGTVVLRRDAVLRVAAAYANGVDRTATRLRDVVKAAKLTYATRWGARLAELERDYRAGVDAAVAAYAVGGPGARWLLDRLIGENDWNSDGARLLAQVGAVLELAPPALALASAKETQARQVNAGTRTWLMALDAAQLARLAGAVAARLAGALLPPAEQVAREQAAERATWAERPVPWITATPLVPEEVEEEDGDDVPAVATCVDCGCDDDHACGGGCTWLDVRREHGVGVCSTCAATLADAVARLDGYLAARGEDTPDPAGALGAAAALFDDEDLDAEGDADAE